MSLLNRYECPTCGRDTGYAGLRASQDELRAHLACTCPTNSEIEAQEALFDLTVKQLTGQRAQVWA